jgi:hypothetical protein
MEPTRASISSSLPQRATQLVRCWFLGSALCDRGIRADFSGFRLRKNGLLVTTRLVDEAVQSHFFAREIVGATMNDQRNEDVEDIFPRWTIAMTPTKQRAKTPHLSRKARLLAFVMVACRDHKSR